MRGLAVGINARGLERLRLPCHRATIEPLAKWLAQRIVGGDYVLADDTTLRVLDRDHANGVKRGRMWAFVADDW